MNRYAKKLSLLLAFSVAYSPLYATPSISGSSGTPGNGNNLTLTGSNFLTRPQGAPQWGIWDFENGTTATSADSRGSTSLTIQNSAVDATARGTFSTRMVKSISNWCTAGAVCISCVNTNIPDAGRGGYIYASAHRRTTIPDRVHLNAGVNVCENWKFIRSWAEDGNNYPNSYQSQLSASATTCTGGCGKQFYTEQAPVATHRWTNNSYIMPNPSWVFEEHLVKWNSANGIFDGRWIIRQNGVVISDKAYSQDYSGESAANLRSFFFQENGSNLSDCSGPGKAAFNAFSNYFDDVIYDYSPGGPGAWARVYLINASSLASATAFEDQTIVSWSNTSITIKQSNGEMSNAQAKWLVVCDQGDVCSTPVSLVGGGAAAPTVTSVTPNSGTIAGGNTVTIAATGLQVGAQAKFGSNDATGENVISAISMTAVVPAGTGIVTVRVTNPDAQFGDLSNGYTYTLAAPTVTLITPNSGTTAGNQTITVGGTNFVNGAVAAIDGVDSPTTFVSSTQLSVITPAHAAGAVNVKVTNPDAQNGTLTNGYTYVTITPPVITTADPISVHVEESSCLCGSGN